MFRTVLVATDGSEAAEKAVRTAIELALSLQSVAFLHVVGVVHYADLPAALGKQPDGAPDLLGEQIDQALSSAEATVREAGVPFQVHRLEGEVVDAILGCAAEVGADILVCGALGRSRLARLVLGSVTGKLVRSTDLPVIVVHADSTQK